ncbi:MAG TPA: macro domain-containing protein, partial [Rhodothermales bacterium]|nr:macro domain-containing protein [Rhodothermales bacterium]
MIELCRGDILKADEEALVNTVNCVGVMGKGIALQFRNKYPENYEAYADACKAKELKVGRMFVFDRGALIPGAWPRYIINFPTKEHWRGKSKLEYVLRGLDTLVDEVRRRGITSIAVPPLGCGNGGLKWREVRPAIERAFARLPDVRVLLYEPAGAPKADAMEVRTVRPKMTPAQAAIIRLLELYQSPQYRHG